MNTQERLIAMLEETAAALGPKLLETSAFVGGCVVGLLITDEFTKEQVRATDDVDLIVDVMNYAAYAKLAEELRARGFKESMSDDIQCRWRLRELIVDVMPIDEKVLGFTNNWYAPAMASAVTFDLPSGCKVRIVSAPYFVATKIEAFRGRGGNDYLFSRDIEDIVTIVDGREELAVEVNEIGGQLKSYIAQALRQFLSERDFEYAVESAVKSDGERAEVIFSRLEALAAA
jgi:hypothetical protein